MIRPTVSVCLATYNGAPFIEEQLTSILVQLEPNDEVIIVDDASRDNTVDIVASIQDRRVRILRNSRNTGVVSTFERALSASCGDLIFLSDQDDRWCGTKVEKMLNRFQDPSVTLVTSSAFLMREDGTPAMVKLHRRLNRAPGVIRTILKNQYQGSLIAFRRSLLPAVLPFPKGIAMHDWWVGAVNGIVGRAVVIPEPLVFYRRHGNNATPDQSRIEFAMVTDRVRLIASLLSRLPRLLRYRWKRH